MKKIRPLTEAEKKLWPRGVLVPLERPFADARGEIQPLVDLMMQSAVLIRSTRGSVRANHYHRSDWHFCYVLEGKIDYYHREHGKSGKPRKVTVKEGQLFFTPPMVEHAMLFPKATTFLVLGRNSRAQEVYEADVVRIPPLKT